MKKTLFVLIAIFALQFTFATEIPTADQAGTTRGIDSVLYSSLASEISGVRSPQVSGRHAIFTAEGNVRHAGIAFEHEDYRKIHSFSRITPRDEFGLPLRNADGSYSSTTLFFILEIPPEMREIRYRIVRDGLWMADPLNPQSAYDFSTGTRVSVLPVEYYKVYETSCAETGFVRFVYEGESGEVIRLAGNFNNWDPFMYEMQEVARGKYELRLPLPKGTWYYAFFQGTTQITDTSAAMKVYTPDGRIASVITVD